MGAYATFIAWQYYWANMGKIDWWTSHEAFIRTMNDYEGGWMAQRPGMLDIIDSDEIREAI